MSEDPAAPDRTLARWATSYGLAALAVAAAAVLGFAAEHIAPGADISLVFVLPVVICAAVFGWGPAVAAGVGGVLVFDFFFTAPRQTLRVAEASDLLSLALLAAIAAVVSTLAARARKQARESATARDRTRALADLAQACQAAASREAALAPAAQTLRRLFAAPAVIYARRELAMTPVATAGAPQLGPAEQAAARWVLGSQVHARGESYPHDASRLDFWPLGEGLVAGVDFTHSTFARPERADALVAVVAAVLRQAPP